MSKCYGLPGCRVGWIVSRNEKLLEKMPGIREYISITNNTIGEVLSLKMLKRKDAVLEAHRQHIAKNKKVIGEWIANHEHLEWMVSEVGVVGYPASHGSSERDASRCTGCSAQLIDVPGSLAWRSMQTRIAGPALQSHGARGVV